MADSVVLAEATALAVPGFPGRGRWTLLGSSGADRGGGSDIRLSTPSRVPDLWSLQRPSKRPPLCPRRTNVPCCSASRLGTLRLAASWWRLSFRGCAVRRSAVHGWLHGPRGRTSWARARSRSWTPSTPST
jgi:hypothetical protein